MSFEVDMMSNLKQFRERLVTERAERIESGKDKLSFGVQFLDEALGGIYKTDLVLLGAKTGIGKTALATIIAKTSAAIGKRVHFFALEAANKEIERRIKYQILAENFYRLSNDHRPKVDLQYRPWLYGELDLKLGPIEDEIQLIMQEMYPNLHTFYKPRGNYMIEDFEKAFMALQDSTDLVIVDHLHYFDSDDPNENRAMKKIVMKIRDMALEVGKPVVCVAHMRKSDRAMKQLCPGLDDFMGSSDISKISTKAITLARCYDKSDDQPPHISRTYIRAAKQRDDSSTDLMIAETAYNARLNGYEKQYGLGRLNYMEDKAKWITTVSDMPWWASRTYAQLAPEEDHADK